MLSHHERVELDKIERWFETSDPELAAALRRGKPARSAALLTAFAILLDVAACGLLVSRHRRVEPRAHRVRPVRRGGRGGGARRPLPRVTGS